jgi:hypothetical protein
MPSGNIGNSLKTLVLLNPDIFVDEDVLEKYGSETAWFHKGHGIRLHFSGTGYKYLHSVLYPHAEVVDHKDRNVKNNFRSNLRPCTKGQNNINREVINPDSGYRGVSWNKAKKAWYARLQYQGKSYISTGYYCKHQAAKHYNFFAKKYHGEFAQLNDVPQ